VKRLLIRHSEPRFVGFVSSTTKRLHSIPHCTRIIVPFWGAAFLQEVTTKKDISLFKTRSDRVLLCILVLFSFIALGTSNANAADGIRSAGNCTVIDKPGSYVLAHGTGAPTSTPPA
jgi:hypothetical protein